METDLNFEASRPLLFEKSGKGFSGQTGNKTDSSLQRGWQMAPALKGQVLSSVKGWQMEMEFHKNPLSLFQERCKTLQSPFILMQEEARIQAVNCKIGNCRPPQPERLYERTLAHFLLVHLTPLMLEMLCISTAPCNGEGPGEVRCHPIHTESSAGRKFA